VKNLHTFWYLVPAKVSGCAIRTLFVLVFCIYCSAAPWDDEANIVILEHTDRFWFWVRLFFSFLGQLPDNGFGVSFNLFINTFAKGRRVLLRERDSPLKPPWYDSISHRRRWNRNKGHFGIFGFIFLRQIYIKTPSPSPCEDLKEKIVRKLTNVG